MPSTEQLQPLAWQAVEPQYQARLAALGEEFTQAQAKDLGSGDLGELTANMGGQVLVIPADLMPVQTGLAATYRY